MRRIEVLDRGAVPKGGVLRSGDFTSITNSDEIIRNTQSWAATRRKEIEQKLQEERALALSEARREGLQAFLAARDAYNEAVVSLTEKLDFLLNKSIQRLLGALPPRAVLMATLGPVLADLRHQSGIRIRVHSDQVEAVHRFLKSLPNGTDAFTVVADATLNTSDCVILTEGEIFNFSLPILTDQLMAGIADYLELARKAQIEEWSADAASKLT